MVTKAPTTRAAHAADSTATGARINVDTSSAGSSGEWRETLDADEQASLEWLDGDQLDYLASVTPFARSLQIWLWNRRPSWSHSKLRKAAGISEATVNAWFSKSTLPDPTQLHKLRKVVDWPDDKLLRLTGYKELPAYIPDFAEFALEHVDERFNDNTGQAARVKRFIADMQEKYADLVRQNAPKRPARGRQTQPRGSGNRKTR